MPENPTGNFEKKIPINIETPESFNLKEINESLSKLGAITLEKVPKSDPTVKTNEVYNVKYKGNMIIGSFKELSFMSLTETQAIQQVLAADKGNKIDPARKQALEKRIQEIEGSKLTTAWEGRIKTIPGLNVIKSTESDFRITSDGTMKMTAQIDGGEPIADDGTGFPLTNITQLEVVTTNGGNPKIIKTIDKNGERGYITCSRADGLSETRSFR